MKHPWKWIWAVCVLTASTTVHAQNWNGLLDRVGEHVAKTIEDRLSKTSDKAAGKGFDGMDGTVDCAAGDEACRRSADEEGKGAAAQGGGSAPVKCVATDVACLKDAQAHAQPVAIVSEEDLDTLRCSATDAKCLQRAKTLGKKIEITD